MPKTPGWPGILLSIIALFVGISLTPSVSSATEYQRSPISIFEVPPTGILWETEQGVKHAETLLAPGPLQPTLTQQLPPCTLDASNGPAGILLDFGCEIQGHIEIATPIRKGKQPLRVRVRFGESAAEAMADLGGATGAQNDHAVRDQTVLLPWLGTKTIGPSGFRFVRIDAVDVTEPVLLTKVIAKLGIRDIPMLGSFTSNDERLNRIWQVGARTVHLCMQDYLWDGIKRDRLVWVGDMHPEVSTIHAVFGLNDVVTKSLDLIRDTTPATNWMNGISSYSMWWVLIHEDLWRHHGKLDYLKAQQPYLNTLLRRLATLVGPDGHEKIDGVRFLDWPSSTNQQGVTAGLHALLVMTLESGSRLSRLCGDEATAAICLEAATRARTVTPDANGSKSGAALLALAGLREPREVATTVLLPDKTQGISTFYGFYVLEALAAAGEIDAAIEIIRTYWGAMLDLGATTFWEDFDLSWISNAAPIDALVPAGMADIHGDYGDYCYKGYRHSLCHGWASGPTAWLSRHVLGVTPLEPGFKRTQIAPKLGLLQWAEGTYPTPKGVIHVRHERQPDGSIESEIEAPSDIDIILVGSKRRATKPSQTASCEACELTCEWLQAPQGVTTPTPRLSWKINASTRSFRQAAYQILVATTEENLTEASADLWDSGRVASSETLRIAYQGKPLQSGQRAVWAVRVWPTEGHASQWSVPTEWTMGLLAPHDWKGEWISCPEPPAPHADPSQLFLPPARHYRREFTVAKPVRLAVLHGTALGIVDWSIDGTHISDALFEPGWTDYHRRVPSRTHDVTVAFQNAAPNTKHCLGATVADGWYAGYVGYGLLVGRGPYKTGRAIYGNTPAILCQLDLEYADGTHATVVTDQEWQVTDAGPIREADLLMGEVYDARKEMPGWNTADFTAIAPLWQPAVPAGAAGSLPVPFHEPGTTRTADLGFTKPASIDGYAAPPIKVTQELPATSVTEWQPGVFIFDLGQNFAGMVRLQVQAAAGTKIQLRFGEMLHADGRLMTENLRRARATDTYICNGRGIETWAPRFTYHGFQYVEVRGLPVGTLPPLETITGLVIHNDTPLTSRFACSDPVMTQFWKNTQWTQRANFIEVPTDCPQRDERLGWMGDAQIYARTATLNADVAAFFTKWIRDVREAQVSEGPNTGAYPDYAPYPFAHGKPDAVFGTAWTDAGVICPWTMWRVYGDERLLKQHWDSMTRFMDWRLRQDESLQGIEAGNTWGDWLHVNEPTPIPFVDLCYHAQSARMMADMGAALGHAAAASAYEERLATLKDSFRDQYVQADGTLSVRTQTACVLALATDVLPKTATQAVVNQLVDRIEASDTRMATGFLGTKSILPVLSASGHHDLACQLFQSQKFPSWGYEVAQGANTVWERWDSYTKENGFEGATGGNNAAMNSFSHYAFGAVMEWAYRRLAGIDELEPGYQRILIRPQIPSPSSNPGAEPITWVKADYKSVRGLIQSHWRRDGKTVEMQVTIPPNTTAEVHVPCSPTGLPLLDGQPLAEKAGDIESIRRTPTAVILPLGSGRYRLTGQLD